MPDRLLLASSSPRRADLLARTGFEFEVVPSGADENIPPGIAPPEVPTVIARRKADAAVDRRPSAISDAERRHEVILAADTLVVAGEILGKPADEADARRMLRSLSGRSHTVITGFALIRGTGDPIFDAAIETEVVFKELSDPEIDGYIATGEPFDKAGAYGIQGHGAFLVRRIAGSYTNVVGLPLVEVIEALATHTDIRPFASAARRT